MPSMNCSCGDNNCASFNTEWGESVCNECTNGTFLHLGTCCPCLNCKGGNENCDSKQGCMNGCVKGFYPSETGCDKHCNIEHCSKCESHSSTGERECIQCETGWYPINNECFTCSVHCLGQKYECSNETGVCENGCVVGVYGERCDSVCEANCHDCDNERGVCLVCELGFWGEKCTKCINNCEHCDQTNGECIACNEGYHGSNCTKACVNCISEKCVEDTFDCTVGCKPGWYGTTCEDKCIQGCDECHDGETCFKCADNKLGDQCEFSCPKTCSECLLNFLTNDVECIKCKPQHTVSQKMCACTLNQCHQFQNIENTKCSKCIDGWFLFGTTCCPCEQCDLDITRCHQTGVCPDECMPAYANKNTTCKTECSISKCSWCHSEKDNKDSCIGCMDGFYPELGACVPCNINCAGDGVNSCDVTTGGCHSGCKGGYFGKKCTTKCPLNCKICGDKQGSCKLCKEGFYGPMCENKCSKTCQNCGNTMVGCLSTHIERQATCNMTSGVCLHGCLAGFYDEKCESECKRCQGDICDLVTGACSHGCIDGWKGDICNSK